MNPFLPLRHSIERTNAWIDSFPIRAYRSKNGFKLESVESADLQCDISKHIDKLKKSR